MTEEQARKLAWRIVDTWPTGAKAYVWSGVLLNLDHHAADVTVRLLTGELRSPPTPGTFLAAYRTQRARLLEPVQMTLADEAETIGPTDALARVADPVARAALERVARRPRRSGLSRFGARRQEGTS